MLYLDHTDSPLGPITMASDGVNLTGLWFDGQKYFPELRRHFCRTLLLRERPFSRTSGKFSVPSPMEKPGPMDRSLSCTHRSTESCACPHRRWAVPWGTIPSPFSFPATGLWEQTEVSPAMPEVFSARPFFLNWKMDAEVWDSVPVLRQPKTERSTRRFSRASFSQSFAGSGMASRLMPPSYPMVRRAFAYSVM